MSRTFTSFAEHDSVAKMLVQELPCIQNDAESYRMKMRELGQHLAEGIIPTLDVEKIKTICVVCTVEDADFLARGVIEQLEVHHLAGKTRLICLWNQRVKREGVPVSPVLRTYEEPFDKNNVVFIIVKSIISGGCVVKTNLTKALSAVQPSKVYIAAPVMLEGAEGRLSREFPDSISACFEFVHFATDDERSADGEEVIPGVGGSVYELLGLGDENQKNKYIPEIVRQRRKLEIYQPQVA
ncbi:hypothetical protein WAE61_11665 [Comamonadaceae bacterium PP-2]